MNINPNLKSNQRPYGQRSHPHSHTQRHNEKQNQNVNKRKQILQSDCSVCRYPAYGGWQSTSFVRRMIAAGQGDEMTNFNIFGLGLTNRKVSIRAAVARHKAWCVSVCVWSLRVFGCVRMGNLFVVCRLPIDCRRCQGAGPFVTFRRINKSNYGKWKTIRSVHLFYSVLSTSPSQYV